MFRGLSRIFPAPKRQTWNRYQSYHSTATALSGQDITKLPFPSDDCPVCHRWRRGPCGDVFEKWFQCANRNENYIHQCKSLFRDFEMCLAQAEEEIAHAASIPSVEEEQETKEAWEDFIREQVDTLPVTQDLPVGVVRIEGTSVVKRLVLLRHVLDAHLAQHPLTLLFFYAQDADTKELLVAGSGADLSSGKSITVPLLGRSDKTNITVGFVLERDDQGENHETGDLVHYQTTI